jgi:predicted site-specific integrase-resolvase
MSNDVFLSDREVAERLGVTVHRLRRWRREGTGPAFVETHPTGTHVPWIRYRASAVEAFKAGSAAGTTEAETDA